MAVRDTRLAHGNGVSEALLIPKGEASKLVPQDPGLNIRLGVCGRGLDSARKQALNEKPEGIRIAYKGDFAVLDDDGVEGGRMVREQVLGDAPDGGSCCVAHSHEDGGRVFQPQ